MSANYNHAVVPVIETDTELKLRTSEAEINEKTNDTMIDKTKENL